MEEQKWESEVSRLVQSYKQMETLIPGSSILREVRYQYLDMSSGGTGGELGFEENGETTCRGVNYPGYPDWVFRKVIEQMGWNQ